MRGWLRRALFAAHLAGERADLWPAGALAWLAFLGWVPFLVVVARPDPNDLAFLGVSLYTSGAFPANLIALAAGLVVLVALLCLLSATAQVSLLRNATAPGPLSPRFGRGVLSAFAIVLLALLPALAALAALLSGVASVAPDAFTSPDTSTPILLRLAGPLVPFLLVFVVALLAGQAFGGTSLRVAHRGPSASVTTILGQAARTLVRRPLGPIGLVVVGLLLDLLVLVLSIALLSVLWSPIGDALQAGRLATPETLLLLLGFVAIWMGLLLVAGAVQVAVSAWWAIELTGRGRAGADREMPADMPPVEGSPPVGMGSGGAR
jgi:hypothetical protein